MKRKAIATLFTAVLMVSTTLTAYAAEIVCFQAVRVERERAAYEKPKMDCSKQELSKPKPKATSQNEKIEPADLVDDVVELVNTERRKAGFSTLQEKETLNQMAEIRAKELAENYSHVRPNGESCTTIFDEIQTDLIFYGENAAKGQKTPERVMEAWMESDGHKANILRNSAEYIGVGMYEDEKGIRHWIEIFATNKALAE